MINNKRIKKILIVFVIMFLFVSKVEADTCTKTEKNTLTKSAKTIEIIPYLDDEYDPFHSYKYNVYITNLTKDYYIVDSNGNRFEYSNDYTSDTVFGNYEQGSKVSFKIYGAYDGVCPDVLLATKTIRFDYYNDYSTFEECEGIEEFKLCQRNYSGEIESKEWFLEQVEKYKAGLIENPDPGEEKLTLFEKIIEFLKENVVVTIGIVVAFVIGLILLIRKLIQNKKKIKVDFGEKREKGEKYEKKK